MWIFGFSRLFIADIFPYYIFLVLLSSTGFLYICVLLNYLICSALLFVLFPYSILFWILQLSNKIQTWEWNLITSFYFIFSKCEKWLPRGRELINSTDMKRFHHLLLCDVIIPDEKQLEVKIAYFHLGSQVNSRLLCYRWHGGRRGLKMTWH